MPATPDHAMLSSERIHARFGSYGLDVLECDERHRVSSLYSLSDGEKICLTFAQVSFNIPVDPALADEHTRVLTGESIGATFQSAGWRITRRHLQVAETPLSPAEREIIRLMRIPPITPLATHTYIFQVTKNGSSTDYARITERHHPAYLTAADLRTLYGLEARPRLTPEARFTT